MATISHSWGDKLICLGELALKEVSVQCNKYRSRWRRSSSAPSPDRQRGIAMRSNAFHLAWFLQGSSIQAWGAPWTGNISDEWMSADMFLDLARAIERACFDYMLLEELDLRRRNLWRHARLLPEERHVGAAPGALGRRHADGGRDTAGRHRADTVHVRLRTVSGGADRRYARSGVGRARRLEHGDRQLRSVGAEFRPWTGCLRTTSATTWPTNTSRSSGSSSDSWEPGAIVADRKRRADRSRQGPHDRLRRANITARAGR